MDSLYCACCGRPFHRASTRGPAPLYCSHDCRLQMAVRRRVWSAMDAGGKGVVEEPMWASSGRVAGGASGRALGREVSAPA